MDYNQNTPKTKNIEVGKFYFIHDGSKTGHPGLVVWKDDDANRYMVVRFDSDKEGDVPKKDRGVRHITCLSHPTDNNVIRSYVRNRPMICKRRDFGSITFPDMKIHPNDSHIIEYVSNQKPDFSPSFKKK